MRAHLEPPREDERRRQDDQRDEPEAPVEHEEADDSREQVRVLTTSVVSPWESTSESASTSDVSARDDPACLLLREVLQRQRGQMVEEIFAQPEHDVLADPGEPAHEGRLQDPGEGVDHEIDDDVSREACLVVRLHAVVDRVLDDEQRGDGGRRGADADHGEERDAEPAAGEVAAEPRQPDALLMRRH